MSKKVIIIAHPGRQHSFRLVEALKEREDYTVKYITTVYSGKRNLLNWILHKVLKRDNYERFSGREISGFDLNNVKTYYTLFGVFETLLSRIDKTKKIYHIWRKLVSHLFGIKVAKYAIKNDAKIVVCFDTNSVSCFKYLYNKDRKIIRVLDSSAANRIYMKKIYEKEIQKQNYFSKKLKQEVNHWLSKKQQNYFRLELFYSQYILAPSTFVKRSYVEVGSSPSKVMICPYGVDLKKFKYSEKVINNKVNKFSVPLEFVYIGGTKQLKGISYLLDAFEVLENDNVRLTIIGKNDLIKSQYNNYKNISFTGLILHEEVSKILSKMDVMIFPSLGEGMSLSILEALSSGLPVICSKNSGTNDLIENGANGFVIEIQSTQDIVEKVRWFNDNREKIEKMSINARESTKGFSWESYSVRLNSVIDCLVSNNF
jgi:glycosyltransferase involved in cell wall biosynthesis